MIRWPVPAEIYVDTGVLIAALFPGLPDSTAARTFCNELAIGNARVYTAHIARMDLTRAIRRLATKPGRLPTDIREEFDLQRWDTNPLIRSRWLWHGIREFERLVSQFAVFSEIPFTLDRWRQSVDLMAAESLDSSDAINLATARSVNIETLATTDADFRRIRTPHILLIRDAPLV